MDISVNFSSQIRAANQKKVLNKPFRTDSDIKKFGVYVKNEKNQVVRVNFGDRDIEINTANIRERKEFRIQSQCDTNPGPRWKPKFWDCKLWESKGDSEVSMGSVNDVVHQWGGLCFWSHNQLLKLLPDLKDSEQIDANDPDKERGYEFNVAQLDYVRDCAATLIEQIQKNTDLQKKVLESSIQNRIFLIERAICDIDQLLNDNITSIR